jgi:hypothetical protein
MAKKTFQFNETVICSASVTSSGTLTDPATSMKITIIDPTETEVVSLAVMTKDATGLYHYDYNPAVSAILGAYKIKYVATDGTRITIQPDTFTLE